MHAALFSLYYLMERKLSRWDVLNTRVHRLTPSLDLINVQKVFLKRLILYYSEIEELKRTF